MTRDELHTIARVTALRALAAVEDTLTEFKCREMGHVDAETLSEQMRQRLREDLLALIPLPEGPHGR